MSLHAITDRYAKITFKHSQAECAILMQVSHGKFRLNKCCYYSSNKSHYSFGAVEDISLLA